jgi:hypothetical protein
MKSPTGKDNQISSRSQYYGKFFLIVDSNNCINKGLDLSLGIGMVGVEM